MNGMVTQVGQTKAEEGSNRETIQKCLGWNCVYERHGCTGRADQSRGRSKSLGQTKAFARADQSIC
jgi:hypothetical protein